MSARSIRLIFASFVICAFEVFAWPVHADPIFWLQTTDVPQTPALLTFSSSPGATGTLYLFGSSDTARVGGIGFNIVSSNPSFLSFKSPASYGPQNFAIWNLPGGPITVTPSSILGINGDSLPPAGSGFGPGSTVGNTVLLASFGYQRGLSQGFSNLSLVVGDAEVVDYYTTDYLTFHVGNLQSQALLGVMGASAPIGVVSHFFPEPTTATLLLVGLLGCFGHRCR